MVRVAGTRFRLADCLLFPLHLGKGGGEGPGLAPSRRHRTRTPTLSQRERGLAGRQPPECAPRSRITSARSISIVLTSIAVALIVILTRPAALQAAGPVAGGGAVRNGRPVGVVSSPGSSFATATMRVPAAASSAAGTAGGGSSASSPARSMLVVQLAEQDLSERIGVPRGQIALRQLTPTRWADGSLGAPRPGLIYSQTVTPGYQIVLQTGGQAYVYHSDTGRLVVFCGTS